MSSQPPSSRIGASGTTGAGFGPPLGEAASSPETSPAQAFADVRSKIAELLGYLFYYLAAKIDAARLAVRRRLIRLWMMSVGVLAVAGMVVTAIVLICDGICDGLSLFFHHRWIGELVTGVLVLLMVVAVGWVGFRQVFALSHAKTAAKYDALRQRQRADFGHDVAQRADEGGNRA